MKKEEKKKRVKEEVFEEERCACGCHCHEEDNNEECACNCCDGCECECMCDDECDGHEEVYIEENDKKALKENQKEIEKLEKDLLVANEKFVRFQAEMMNFKRRKEDELSTYVKYSNEDMAKDLLPIVDNFERAIKMEEEKESSSEVSKFLSGFKMIYSSFVGVLNKYEIKEIDADGVEFNPNMHQAVLTEKDDSKPEGVILEVLQKGYTYKDKVIRPAMVKVNE